MCKLNGTNKRNKERRKKTLRFGLWIKGNNNNFVTFIHQLKNKKNSTKQLVASVHQLKWRKMGGGIFKFMK